MSKKSIFTIVRIATMATAFTVLHQVYEIGALGYAMVCLTGVVWAVTASIERDG